MTSQPVRVIVVDDQWMIREGLASLAGLADDIDVVATAGDGDEAIALVGTHAPDVVLMDIRMPHTDGIDATAVIRRDHPATQVLMLTTFDDVDLIERSLDAGGVGYLTKDIAAADLASAVRSAASGVVQLSQHVTRVLRGGLTASSTELESTSSGDPVFDPTGFPPRERDVLALVVEGRSNSQIAAELHLSTGTVKNYVSSILRRLGTTDRTHAAVLAVRHGLID